MGVTKKKRQLMVEDISINVTNVQGEHYVCLTDMVRNIGGSAVVEKWIRNKNTLEYLGVWESLNNPDFNSTEFGGIKNQAGSNRFVLSVKQWIELTGAVGLRAQAGRYGGTYAHKDIAFEFAAWVSPEFKFLVIKEFQRLKIREHELEQWDYRRFLSKVNYKLHTSAVKQTLIPLYNVPKQREWLLYAEEADIINVAVFGMTAKEWRKSYPKLAKSSGNIRDHATITQLTVLANVEGINSMMISQGKSKEERFDILRGEAIRQTKALAPVPANKLTAPSINARLDLPL